jgi:hypothetical protein
LQFISASIEAVCRKTLQEVERDSKTKFLPKNSVKKYMSEKIVFMPLRSFGTEPVGLHRGSSPENTAARQSLLPGQDFGKKLYVS